MVIELVLVLLELLLTVEELPRSSSSDDPKVMQSESFEAAGASLLVLDGLFDAMIASGELAVEVEAREVEVEGSGGEVSAVEGGGGTGLLLGWNIEKTFLLCGSAIQASSLWEGEEKD